MDFTKCKIDKFKLFGGTNGSKIGIVYENNKYMLKFPVKSKINKDISYVSNSFIEDISCKIYKSIGINVQETLLGTYMVEGKEKIVVACKNIEEDGYVLKDFAFLKNTVITSINNGYGTDLEDILETIETQTLVDVNELKNFFWDMFIIDALLGNFDRHNGNWGFLINEKEQKVKIAPIYDCGSCLYSQIDEELMEKVINSKQEQLNRIYEYPTSAIKYNDKKINYAEFLKNNKYSECKNSLLKISKLIDMNKIKDIINSCEYISDIRKDFYITMINLRKTILIDDNI